MGVKELCRHTMEIYGKTTGSNPSVANASAFIFVVIKKYVKIL